MIIRSIVIAAASTALLVAQGAAQQHQHGQQQGQQQGQHQQGEHHGMMEGMGGMSAMSAMMSSMPAGPDKLLRASDELGLDSGQIAALTTLQERVDAEHRGHMQPMMQSRSAAAAALEGDSPDLDAYRTALEGAASHMVAAHVAMARIALEARAILTPEQRSILETLPGMEHSPGGSGHGEQHSGGH